MSDPLSRLTAALSSRYRIERELGQGGMATVYLAHDLKHDRQVAIKVLHEDLGFALGAERFLAEIRTTARLQHPHILPLLDSGSTAGPGEGGGLLYYVMPYVAGVSLRDRLSREKQLPLEDALRITREVADALGHAHAQGIVHRDIKPENILLQGGHALVADFGIALAVASAGGARLTQTGLSLGTPQYMSPEQAMGERTVDARSDVYALGAVLYEMLTGEPPFTGATVAAVVAKVLGTEPAPPTAVRKTVPVHVEAAVLKALAKLPADRFDGAGSFTAALVDARSGGTAATGPRMRAAPRSDWRGRLTLPLVVALVASIALGVWGWLASRDARGGEVLHIPIAFEDPYRERLPWFTTTTIAPDGGSIIYLGPGWRHYRLDLTTGQTTVVTREIASFLGFDFSPSGDSIVVRTRGWLGQLWTVSLATGQANMVTDSALSTPISWSDDGWIYYPSLSAGIRRVRPDGTGKEDLLRAEPGPGGWMAGAIEALPGGRGLLFTKRPWMNVDPTRGEIHVLDLESMTQTPLVRGAHARYAPSGHVVVAQADGALLAAPFDPDALVAKADFRKVLEGVEVRATWDGAGHFTFSDDGDLLYVTEAPFEEDQIVHVDRSGRSGEGVEGWGGWFNGYAIASDGRTQVASVHRGHTPPNLWIREGDEPPRQLTTTPILDNYPLFVGGGRDVVFVSPRNGNNWDLYVVPLDGSAEPSVVLDRPGDIRGPDFFDDDRALVLCETDPVGQGDLLSHRFAPDTATTVLLATASNEYEPALSPNEAWLAYVSDESGRNEVYVRPFARAGRAWQISTDGAAQPNWSRDGRELFFRSAAGDLVAAPVTAGATFTFGPPKVLFHAGELEWTGFTSPDDGEFIMIRKNMRAPGRAILVRNWTKELERILREGR